MPQPQTRQTPTTGTHQSVPETPATAEHVTVEEIDTILDDIDSILEENISEVLVKFVQKGGQ